MSGMLESVGDDRGQLDAFHDLLPALARGLDVREIFRQLSDVAARIVPHDEATLLLQKADGHFEMFASTGTPREVVCCNDPAHALNTHEPQLLDSLPEPDRGLQSGLTVPVRINDQFFGVFALFSRRPQAYAERDLAQAGRLAAYLALALSHQRLADTARDAALDRERAASIETSVELLRTISDVLDVRSVFPRISEISNKILPHDALTMVFHDGHGKVVHEAATDGVPRLTPHAAHGPQPDHFVVGDLATDDLPVVIVGESPREKLLAAGFRSLIAINTRARDQLMGVGFVSRRAHAFSETDVPIARRIVDHIALAISHEQLAEAARQVAEAQARTERLEARLPLLAAAPHS